MPRTRLELPKWAVLVEPDPDVGIEPVTFPDEEAYIRTRCYHEASRSLDQAWQQTMQEASLRIRAHIVPTTTKRHEGKDDSSPLLRKRSLSEANIEASVDETNEEAASSTLNENQKTDNNTFMRDHFTIHTSETVENSSALRAGVESQHSINQQTKLDVACQQYGN